MAADYRLLAYPLESLDLSRLTSSLPKENPGKPIAFIFGHGLHNDVNETASLLWLEQIQQAIAASRPWLADADSSNPRLFITPSSAGVQKPDQYIATQGNVALARFEKALGPAVRERGYDHLGTFNLTIQNTSPDGTHAGFRSNLIKAMMVFNWLSGVGAEG